MIRSFLLAAALFALTFSAQAYDPCMASRAATHLNVPDPNDPRLTDKCSSPDPAAVSMCEANKATAQKGFADATAYHAAAMARYDACNQSAAQAKPIP
jgi:hypothetical protein